MEKIKRIAPSLLEMSRLLLRPMQESDAEALLAVFGEAKVMACFAVAPFDRPQMAQWVQRNLDHQAEYGYGLFSVIHKADNRLIGDCGLEMMTIDGAIIAELGYDFRSDYWNQGYATEAACAVRDFAFGTLRLPRLISLIRAENAASRRVAEKVGMRLEKEILRYGATYVQFGLSSEEAP